MSSMKTMLCRLLSAALALLPVLGQPAHGLTWDRTYGTAGFDIAYDVTPTADGGFIVAGGTEVSPPYRDG